MSKSVHHRACHLCEAICGLTLEVTETTIMQDVQRTDRILRALKAMGMQ